jgi:hypothetical protein
MTRLTAADFHPEVLKLFDRFVHGFISRRDFVDGASKFAVGTATGLTLLEALSPKFAAATQSNSCPAIDINCILTENLRWWFHVSSRARERIMFMTVVCVRVDRRVGLRRHDICWLWILIVRRVFPPD